MQRYKGVFAASISIWLMGAVPAGAFPSILDDFTERYPDATRLDTCGTCHKSFNSGAQLNDYGDALESAGSLAEIENADSDGDGTDNLAEIGTGAGFFPCYNCDNYTEAANAPSDLADFVEPLNPGCDGGPTTTNTSTSTTNTSTSTTFSTTTTTLGGAPRCSQPATSGANPTASDCLFILRAAVGSSTCSPECICNPNGAGGTTASDALLCLKKAVGQSVTLECPCAGTTSTTSPTSTSTTSVTSPTSTSTSTTTGGGSIEVGRALYDSDCSFCHAAGSHDTEGELASDLAGDGEKLVQDLGTLDESMSGITLDEQEIADLMAFLESL